MTSRVSQLTRMSVARRAAILAALLVLVAPAAALAQPTVVSLTFDGATVDQSVVPAMLAERGLVATFFVSSEQVATAGHLGWADLTALATAGNEIGGATATGAWLPGLPDEQVRHEVCDDRDALLARGFAVRSFAHPYRDATAATEAIVRDCGYDSARGGGGFSHDLLPPRDPYFTLTPPIDATTTAAELDARVQETIDDGGGWATLAIGRVCAACGPDAMAPQTLAAVLDRLGARRAAGEIAVRTVGDAIGGPLLPAAHLPQGQTTVSLTFDDGSADEYQLAPMLAARGMHATFFVNSGTIGHTGMLSWTQLAALQAAGHEIGGHTVDHPGDLRLLAPDRQVAEVCGDRAALMAHGLTVTDFAYPHSYEDAAVEGVVGGCGYNSARTVGGLQCPACTYAETVPPQAAFDVLTADEVLAGTTLADLQRRVTTVEHLGGGWVPIVLHRICSVPCGSYGFDPATLQQFLDWLAARRAAGTVVRTVREVVGGPVAPSPDHTAPVTTATCDGGACGGWARATVRVVLAATDAGSGVREVRYTVDGRDPTSASTRYTAPLSFTRSTTLRFRAWDLAGNVEDVRSAAVRIDTTAPKVTLSVPGLVRRGVPVTLQATASDADSGVAAVTFRAGGAVVATDTTAPYTATWTPAAAGRVKLTATAVDAAGNATTSAQVSVTVL